jgi:two-component system, OmpR family, heavy metal sensor histidine kinase CusS
MKPLSIRLQLAVLNAVVLLATFAVAGTVVWLAMRDSIHESVDEDLHERLALLKRDVQSALDTDGEGRLPERLAADTAPRLGARFRLSNGSRWIYQSPGAEQWQATQPSTFPENGIGVARTVLINGRPYRVLATIASIRGNTWPVEIGVPLGDFYRALTSVRSTMLIASPLILLVALTAGYAMSARALAPVDRVTRTARAIGAENLSDRLPLVGTNDEIDRLSETLNDMLGRLEAAFRRVTQFTADASHELRTPIAIIRTTAELARRRPRTPAEYVEALDRILVESERTTRLIDDLLLLARSDASGDEFIHEPLSLGSAVREACAQGRILAEAVGLSFASDVTVDCATMGDAQAIRRLFLILLDNAVKYTPAGGAVTVTMRGDGGDAVIDVHDTGVGISADNVPHVFERFYRVGQDRSRGRGGVGLGLAIAQRIATAHGGRITVESILGKGSTFSVRLPIVAAATTTDAQCDPRSMTSSENEPGSTAGRSLLPAGTDPNLAAATKTR